MAIEVTSAPASSSSGGPGAIGNLILLGGVAGGGYLAYRWWQREQVKAALLAEAERLRAGGMGIKDALTNAAAGACVVAATTYKIPPAQSGPMCNGAAIVAMKAAELTAKGAVIVGKVVGKGAVVVGKEVGHVGAVVGKGIGTGVKAVVYTAPKAVITTVGHTGATVGKGIGSGAKAVAYTAPKAVIKSVIAAPKSIISSIFGGNNINCSVPQHAKNAAWCKAKYPKVDRTKLDAGVLGGLSGIDVYRASVDLALAGTGPRNPLSRVRAPAPRRAAAPPSVSRAGRSRSGRSQAPGAAGVAYYARLFGPA